MCPAATRAAAIISGLNIAISLAFNRQAEDALYSRLWPMILGSTVRRTESTERSLVQYTKMIYGSALARTRS